MADKELRDYINTLPIAERLAAMKEYNMFYNKTGKTTPQTELITPNIGVKQPKLIIPNIGINQPKTRKIAKVQTQKSPVKTTRVPPPKPTRTPPKPPKQKPPPLPPKPKPPPLPPKPVKPLPKPIKPPTKQLPPMPIPTETIERPKPTRPAPTLERKRVPAEIHGLELPRVETGNPTLPPKYLTLKVIEPRSREIDNQIINNINRRLDNGSNISHELVIELLTELQRVRYEVESRENRPTLRIKTVDVNRNIGTSEYTIDDNLLQLVYRNLTTGFEETVEEVPNSDADEILRYNRVLSMSMREILGRGKKNFGFFKHVNMTNIDLTKYQIYNEEQLDKILADGEVKQCLVHAITVANKFEDDKIAEVSNLLGGTGLWKKRNKKLFEQIAEILGVKLIVTHLDKDNRKRCDPYGKGEELKLGIVDEHCFLHEMTSYSKHDVDPDNKSMVLLDSINLVKFIFKKGLFEKSDKIKYGGFGKIDNFVLLDDINGEQRELGKDPKRFEPDWEQKYDIEQRKIANGGEYTEADRTTLEIWESMLDEQERADEEKEDKREKAIELGGEWLRGTLYICADIESDINDYKIVNGNIKSGYHRPIAIGYKTMLVKDGDPEINNEIDYNVKIEGVGYSCVESFLRNMRRDNDKIKALIAELAGRKNIDIEKSHYDRVYYFHHVKYDFNTLVKEFIKCGAEFKTFCKRDSQLYSVKMRYYDCNFEFRDSYKLIPSSLSAICRDFKLVHQKVKGVTFKYPYVGSPLMCKISDYTKYLPDNEVSDFYENIAKPDVISLAMVNNEDFSPNGYLKYYLAYDIFSMEEALLKFRQGCLENIFAGIDIFDCLTISSYANKIFREEGCLEGIYEMKCGLRYFCNKAAPGGRTVCNPKYRGIIICHDIEALDGVSLYPSAIRELCENHGFPRGRAKRITDIATDRIYNEPLNQGDYYIVKILVTSMNPREFPILSTKDETGVTQYLNTVGTGVEITVDKFTLEEYINYHGITYKFIEGVYWNKGFNKRAGRLIQRWFDERVRVKEENPVLGNVYKLLSNSSYGKLMMKLLLIEEKIEKCDGYTAYESLDKDGNKIWKVVKVENKNLDDFICKNGERIQSIKILDNGYFIAKQHANVNNEFNSVHCAAPILSISKRIMNRVFEACDKVGCPIYNSDTDSTHIPDEKVVPVANKYRELYGKELIGKQLGQFHGDLETKSKKSAKAIRSIYIGRKTYCEELKSRDGTETEYLTRSKGIPEAAIKMKYKSEYGGDAIAMYKDAYDNGILVECIVPGVAGIEINFMQGATHKLSYEKILRST